MKQYRRGIVFAKPPLFRAASLTTRRPYWTLPSSSCIRRTSRVFKTARLWRMLNIPYRTGLYKRPVFYELIWGSNFIYQNIYFTAGRRSSFFPMQSLCFAFFSNFIHVCQLNLFKNLCKQMFWISCFFQYLCIYSLPLRLEDFNLNVNISRL